VNALTYIWRRRVFAEAFARLMLDNDRKLTGDGKLVIAAIRHFCRADAATTVQYDRSGRIDALASAVAAGRDEVWRQINFYLNVHPSELIEADRLFARESGLRMNDRLEV
jgi:hypothetical protein